MVEMVIIGKQIRGKELIYYLYEIVFQANTSGYHILNCTLN